MTRKISAITNLYPLKTEIRHCLNETDFYQLIIQFNTLKNGKQTPAELERIKEIETEIARKTEQFAAQKNAPKDPVREKELSNFRAHIFDMSKKAFTLGQEGHTAAAEAAMLLCKKLTNYATLYEINKMKPLDFRNASETAIDIARNELEEHRGWKRVMLNLLVGVCTLGVGYAIAASYKHSFFVVNPNTNSKAMADQLENDITSIGIAPGK